MDGNLKQSQFIIFLKRSSPIIVRVINTVIYAIFSFIKTSVKYAIDQIRNI